jgi:drug/metabolite transporter (DMT)-like permease
MEQKKNLFLAVVLATFSYLCLSSANTIAKVIHNKVGLFQILFLQTLLGLLVISSICLFKRKKLSFYKSDHYGLLFLRSIAGLAFFFFIFLSVRRLSVTDTTLLMNTGPFFVPFLLLLFFKEKIHHLLWLGIILGFLGIFFILNPGSPIFQWYAFLPLISGFCIAVIFIVLRQLHDYREPTLRILFYLFLFATLINLPFGAFNWQVLTSKDWILLILVSVCGFLSQTTVTVSLRYGSPKVVAPLCYISVVFSALYDWLIWDEVPTWHVLIGAFLVILGGVTAILIENQTLKAASKRSK